MREKRDGSDVSSSRVAPVEHVLLVSLTIHERRKNSLPKPPRDLLRFSHLVWFLPPIAAQENKAALLTVVPALIRPSDLEDGFKRSDYEARQRDPNVIMAYCEMKKLLTLPVLEEHRQPLSPLSIPPFFSMDGVGLAFKINSWNRASKEPVTSGGLRQGERTLLRRAAAWQTNSLARTRIRAGGGSSDVRQFLPLRRSPAAPADARGQ